MGELIGSIRQLWNGNNLHLIKSHANILYTKQGNLSNNECSTAHLTPQKVVEKQDHLNLRYN